VTALASDATVGIDLGGTNLRVAVVDAAGAIVDEHREPTPQRWDALLDALVTGVDAVRGDRAPLAVGVGAAGLVDKTGAVHYAPNLAALSGAALGPALRERLGVPVVVDNDANAAAWGEVCHGAARGRRDVLMVTLGTGVGGGIILDGRVVRGAHGFAAEIGHWQVDPHGARCSCGEVGHWEAMASGPALGRLAQARATAGNAPDILARASGVVEAITGFHVGASAQAGARDGLSVLQEYADVVAVGFAGLVNILDPELIVISGGLVEMGELLLAPMRRSLATRIEGASKRPAVPVVAAELGERAGLVGAAALARARER
jgi:glucokinase